MFKGTGTVGPTEFSRTVSRNGGRDNAYTSFDIDRLLPDRGARPARAGDAHGSRPHGQPAHHREGADPRAPGRARGAPHADRQLARPRCSTRRCSEQLFGRHKPYGMPISGLCRRREEAQRRRPRWRSMRKFYAPNNADPDRRRRHHGRAGAQARREALRADPAPQGRAAAPAGARARTDLPQRVIARRRARRRAALVAAITWRRPIARARASTPMRCRCWRACWAAARPAACGAPWWSIASSRCRPGRQLQPDEPRPHHVRSRRPSRAGHADGRDRERGRRPAQAS